MLYKEERNEKNDRRWEMMGEAKRKMERREE
jgi:hypothetical protein